MRYKDLDFLHEEYEMCQLSLSEVITRAFELGRKSLAPKYNFCESSNGHYYWQIRDKNNVHMEFICLRSALTKSQSQKIAQYYIDVLNGEIR